MEIPLESYFRLDQQVNDATLLSLEDLSIASKRTGSEPRKIPGQPLS
jgi:hypothetical protein